MAYEIDPEEPTSGAQLFGNQYRCSGPQCWVIMHRLDCLTEFPYILLASRARVATSL